MSLDNAVSEVSEGCIKFYGRSFTGPGDSSKGVKMNASLHWNKGSSFKGGCEIDLLNDQFKLQCTVQWSKKEVRFILYGLKPIIRQALFSPLSWTFIIFVLFVFCKVLQAWYLSSTWHINGHLWTRSHMIPQNNNMLAEIIFQNLKRVRRAEGGWELLIDSRGVKLSTRYH